MGRQIAILGTRIHNLTMDETLQQIESFIAEGSFHQVATANTDFLVKALNDPELRSILAHCDLVVSDGMPLVWGSRLMGVPIKERVTGADLVPRLAEISAARGYRIFLLGASADSARRATQNLERRYPGLRIAGRFAPPVTPIEQMDNEGILRQIRAARPHILLVAFGNPKQEKWIARHRHVLEAPVCIGVGAAIDFAAGAAPRAPRWMQVSGLEWIHRLLHDPLRLGPRYLGDILQFSRFFSLQMWAHGLRSPSGAFDTVIRHDIGACSVLEVHGNLMGSLLKSFEEANRAALRQGQNVIADLSGITALGADALATLLNLRQNNEKGRGLKLVGISPRFARVIGFGHLPAAVERDAPQDTLRHVSATLPGAELNVQLSGRAAVCQLSGEVSETNARLIAEIFLKLSDAVTELKFDLDRLSVASRASLAEAGLDKDSVLSSRKLSAA